MKKHPLYVVGHKNPDTDAIVSAIAYARYKVLNGEEAIACRIGSISSQTEYLLEKFGFEDPLRIYTAKSTLKEIEIDKASVVNKDLTMKEALDKVLSLKNRGLIIGDKSRHLEGIVSLDDLTYMWTKKDEELEDIIKTISMDNLLKILEGQVVNNCDVQLSGKMHIFPGLSSNVEAGSIVLLRNDNDRMAYAINKGAKLLIIVTSSPLADEIIKLVKDNKVAMIKTALSPLSVTRLIYQIPTIEQVMQKKDKIEYFYDDETVEEVSKKIAGSRHRSYPVLDKNNKIKGAVSRYHLFNYQKKRFILVDHNEIKQTVDDITSGEVVEIIDHHRFGGFESDNPINITAKTVGATATIIAEKFIKEKLPLSKNLAGILLGAIISDTMNFKSPTTTSIDEQVAEKLEKIAKIDSATLSKEMIEHSESILNKRFIEIVYDDFKEFNIDGNKVGLAQATCKSKEEYLQLKDELLKYLQDTCKSGSYDLMVVMLTDPNGSGSYLLFTGNKKSAIEEIFAGKLKDGFVDNLISRKKQLLPQLIINLGGK